jgi:hypothetical protein
MLSLLYHYRQSLLSVMKWFTFTYYDNGFLNTEPDKKCLNELTLLDFPRSSQSDSGSKGFPPLCFWMNHILARSFLENLEGSLIV